jgi:integrase
MVWDGPLCQSRIVQRYTKPCFKRMVVLQNGRKITFHSWRHFLNSIGRGKVPDEKLRLMTGHRTKEMTDHYTHLLRGGLRRDQEGSGGCIRGGRALVRGSNLLS